MRTEQEINELLDNRLPEGAEGPSKWPGMTYEQGVEAMAHWVTGRNDNDPLED